jgi:hypothetical protein
MTCPTTTDTPTQEDGCIGILMPAPSTPNCIDCKGSNLDSWGIACLSTEQRKDMRSTVKEPGGRDAFRTTSGRSVSQQQYICTSHGNRTLQEGHIRLVKVISGEESSTLCCETKIWPVSSCVEYTALSYAWGDPTAEYPIIMDGCQHLIHKSLWDFLDMWRRKSADRKPYARDSDDIIKWSTRIPRVLDFDRDQLDCWLWVDALSINQSDKRERMHQVSLMSRIFNGATDVVAWLGPSTRETMQALNRKHDGSWPSGKESESDGIEDLCQRSYWGRLWIYQELKVAEHVYLACGEDFIEWQQFLNQPGFNFPIRDNTDTPRESIFDDGVPRDENEYKHMKATAAANMVMLCRHDSPRSLWSLILATARLHCSDPHDRVYAILGLAETGATGIEADYSIPSAQLMHRVLDNLHALNLPRTMGQITRHCDLLRALMGPQHDFSWTTSDYITARKSRKAGLGLADHRNTP